jgi:hypothetical protein
MNFHVRSYGAELAEHYAAVRARLGCLPLIPQEPVLLLPPPVWIEPHVVVDLVPDQRGKEVVPIGTNAELVAARRALMIFARLRDSKPADNSVRHLQVAVAAAFKIDLAVLIGRSRRPGPVRPRQIAMMLARRVCKHTLNHVSARFDRNHATVIHAERKFAYLLDGASSQIGSADGR